MNITIPKPAARIIHTLSAHGFDAYVVGGCVRDSILKKTPADWDIATSARPEQIKALFARTIDTGIRHGTVTVMIGKTGYEVTTYRSSAGFADSLADDLGHRDFTINAMAYNETDGLIDLFGGADDLKDGLIRCVGKAEDRFGEDPLRMLRAVRFGAELGFSVSQEIRDAICQMHGLLSGVSAERIQMELLKLLISDHPEQFLLAYQTGLTGVFLPEFDAAMDTPQKNPHHLYSVGEHILESVRLIEANPVLRLTMLFHDIGKPPAHTTDEEGIDHFYGHNKISAAMTKDILKRLKFDNKTSHIVCALILHHDIRFFDPKGEGRAHVRRVMHSIGPVLFPYLLKVMEADVRAQSDYMRSRKLSLLRETHEVSREILEAGDCLSLKELSINGRQLKALGIREGREIGDVLNALLDMVLENPALNDPRYLRELALKIHRELHDPDRSRE